MTNNFPPQVIKHTTYHDIWLWKSSSFWVGTNPCISLKKKKLNTFLKCIDQLETYLLILPIMLHHFRINTLLSTSIKHKSREIVVTQE